MDFTDIFLYFKVEDNYPIFRKRGEYSEKGILVEKKFFSINLKYYENNILNLSVSDKEKIKLAQEYIDKNKKYFHGEGKSEYEERIKMNF